MSLLRTPEEVAADLGHISQHTIRSLIRQGKIEYTALARGKFAMTDAQVDGLLAYLARQPRPVLERPMESPFGSSQKSRTSRRKP